MKVIVIHNPDAGCGDWSAERVNALLSDAGHTAEIATKDSDWRPLLHETPDAFVVAGGDGTVHDVAHALVDRNIPLAILPLGTANNVAYALGYRANGDLLERAKRWQRSEQTVQIAEVDVGADKRCFIESVGAGAFAKMLRTNGAGGKKSVPPLGVLAIRKALVKKLLRMKPVEVALRFGNEHVADEFLLVECLNIPFYGPRLHAAPAESASDALLTVCAVRAHARDAVAEWMASGVGDPDRWIIGRAAELALLTDERTHVDGEIWPAKEARTGQLRIRAGAHAIRLMV